MRRSHLHAVETSEPSQLFSGLPSARFTAGRRGKTPKPRAEEYRSRNGTPRSYLGLSPRPPLTRDTYCRLSLNPLIFGDTREFYVVPKSHVFSQVSLLDDDIRRGGPLEFEADDIIRDPVSKQNAINARKCISRDFSYFRNLAGVLPFLTSFVTRPDVGSQPFFVFLSA